MTPTNSIARNLGVILTHHHSRSQNISHPCLNHAFYPFMTFVESGTLSTFPLLKPSPPLSFILRSTTVYMHSLFLNLLCCQLDLLLILNSTARAVSKTPIGSAMSHPSSSYTCSKLISASSTKFSISLTYKTLRSQKPSYLYNLLNLLANTSTRSSTVITLRLKNNR